jgi:hypothetical protein
MAKSDARARFIAAAPATITPPASAVSPIGSAPRSAYTLAPGPNRWRTPTPAAATIAPLATRVHRTPAVSAPATVTPARAATAGTIGKM